MMTYRALLYIRYDTHLHCSSFYSNKLVSEQHTAPLLIINNIGCPSVIFCFIKEVFLVAVVLQQVLMDFGM